MTIDKYILIQAESRSDASELAGQVAKIPGVAKVERVSGPYDVIAEVTEPAEDVWTQPADSAIRRLEGVLRTISVPILSRTFASEGPKTSARRIA